MACRQTVKTILAAAALLLGVSVDSYGQSVGRAQPANGQRLLTPQTQRVLNFYGATTQASAPLRQIPVRPASAPARPRLPKDKPFSADANRPTVSPFMNIFRDDDLDSAPNYYAFVRPQQQQHEFAESQRFENQKLRRQVQRASVGLGISPTGNTNLPTTGHATRFMSVGGFYRETR